MICSWKEKIGRVLKTYSLLFSVRKTKVEQESLDRLDFFLLLYCKEKTTNNKTLKSEPWSGPLGLFLFIVPRRPPKNRVFPKSRKKWRPMATLKPPTHARPIQPTADRETCMQGTDRNMGPPTVLHSHRMPLPNERTEQESLEPVARTFLELSENPKDGAPQGRSCFLVDWYRPTGPSTCR